MNIVKHYKGKYYKILYHGHHTETNGKMVIYQQLYENEYPYGYVWVRPYDMFHEQIIYNNKIMKRFEPVDDVLS
jgi:hypothetical protein